MKTHGYRPGIDTPYRWSPARNGVEWRRWFRSEEAAWSALCGATYNFAWLVEKQAKRKAEMIAKGYTICVKAWHVNKDVP